MTTTTGQRGTAAAVTDTTFEQDVLHADRPVLVDFWSQWCPPCRISPVLAEIAAERVDSLLGRKINADENCPP